MASSSEENKVPCTFSNCNYLFTSLKEMKKHKAAEPEHDYCPKCDEDFQSEEQYLIHMIKSNKHIVCPICGVEFRSEGGRDGHIRQQHRTPQNLTCYGCKGKFKSAAGLMRHIENDECLVISKERLLLEQSKKLMLKEALDIATPSARPDPDVDDVDGGVLLNMDLINSNREAIANQPNQGDYKDSVSAALAEKHWPALAEREGTEVDAETAPSDLMTFSDAAPSSDQEITSWKGKGRAASVINTDLIHSDRSDGASTTIGSTVGPPDPALQLRQIYRKWEPELWRGQLSGNYECPCGKSFLDRKAFENHVLVKSKGSRRVQCPGCLRIFRSTAALIAHCESTTTRCDVSEGHLYAQIIDELSGGIIQMAGYNEDGTLKYEAGENLRAKTTTIGRNLRKVDW